MPEPIVKAGGIAGLVAAVLLVLSSGLSWVTPPGASYLTTTDYAHQVIRLLAFLAALVTLVGLQVRQESATRFGWLGTAGTVLTGAGYTVVVAVVAAGIIAGSRVLNDVRVVGAVLLLVGSALLGVATLRARLLPWWCGVLLVVAFPLGDVADTVVPGAEGLLFAALWGSVGVALLTQTGRQVGEVSEPVEGSSGSPSVPH